MKASKWLFVLSITLLPRIIYANSALGDLGYLFYLLIALVLGFVFVIILPTVQIILMVISHRSQVAKYLKAIKILGWINLVLGVLNLIGYIFLIEMKTIGIWLYVPIPLFEITLGFLGIRQSLSKG